MASSAAAPARASARSTPAIAKYVLFAVYAALVVVVYLTRDHQLLEPGSFLRERYAPVSLLVWLHGLPGAVALFLGIFQFSARLRQRYIQVHRILGRVYVGGVFISAPAAMIVALKLPIPSLAAASYVQGIGWMLATATALYCVRTGRIQQHREWMYRSYPFAAVFVVNRALIAIPAIARGGLPVLAEVVWTVIAVACFLPSFLIEWQHLASARKPVKARVVSMER